VFFVRNAADPSNSRKQPVKFFFPSLNLSFNFHPHQFKIIHAFLSTKVANPLAARYGNMTPYLFGDTAMQFSARPFGVCLSVHRRVWIFLASIAGIRNLVLGIVTNTTWTYYLTEGINTSNLGCFFVTSHQGITLTVKILKKLADMPRSCVF